MSLTTLKEMVHAIFERDFDNIVPAIPYCLTSAEAEAFRQERLEREQRERAEMQKIVENRILVNEQLLTNYFRWAEVSREQILGASTCSLLEWFRARYNFRFFKIRNSLIDMIDFAEDGELVTRRELFFAPLSDNSVIFEYLIGRGFYRSYVEFKMDWHCAPVILQVRDDFVKQFLIDGNNRQCYYFWGDIGVGKTTLITALAKLLSVFLSNSIYFITSADLLQKITSVDESVQNYIERLKCCDILFIDDFGFENIRTDTQNSFMRKFFTHRYSHQLPMILCGNTDIRSQREKNSFYYQVSDYIDDSSVFNLYELRGESRRRHKIIENTL